MPKTFKIQMVSGKRFLNLHVTGSWLLL